MTRVSMGSQLRAAMWFDTIWPAVAPGAAVYELPVANTGNTWGETEELLDSAIARGGRAEADPVTGNVTAQGLQLTVVPGYQTAPWLLKAAIGKTITPTGTGPYTHDGSLGDLCEGFGLELAIVHPSTPASSTLYRMYGCWATRLQLPLAQPSGECQWVLTFDAYSVVRSVGAPITATAYTETPLLYRDLSTLTIDDGGGADDLDDITNISLDIDMGASLTPTARNSGRVGLRELGVTMIRGQLETMLHSTEVYTTLATNRTYFELVAGYANGSDAFTVTLPRCRLETGQESSQGPQGIPLQRNLRASDDDTAGTSISWQAVNSIASYPDP
jgi:Phage tail tube protein